MLSVAVHCLSIRLNPARPTFRSLIEMRGCWQILSTAYTSRSLGQILLRLSAICTTIFEEAGKPRCAKQEYPSANPFVRFKESICRIQRQGNHSCLWKLLLACRPKLEIVFTTGLYGYCSYQDIPTCAEILCSRFASVLQQDLAALVVHQSTHLQRFREEVVYSNFGKAGDLMSTEG